MRVAWFYGNPNETATLLGCLMVASWAFWNKSKIGFRTLLGLNLLTGVALMGTASRGGIVSTAMALFYLGATHGVPRGQRRWVTMISVIGAIALLLSLSGGRFIKAVQGDASVQNRWVIWKEAPRMMIDAPQGWENPAEAFHQYYQPIGRGENYRHLVNSHLTWLVSFSWAGRFLYLLSWSMGLILLLTQEGRVRVAGAVWLCFGLNAFFSSVAEEWTLWLIPNLMLLYALTREQSHWRKWFSTVKFFISFAFTLTILSIILLLGFSRSSAIQNQGHGIVVIQGKGEAIFLDQPQKSVLGDKWGHQLRASGQHWVVGRGGNKTICIGEGNWQGVEEGIWLNPIAIPDPAKPLPVQGVIWMGEYFQPSRQADWQRWIQAHPGWSLKIVEGARDYLPNWIHETE